MKRLFSLPGAGADPGFWKPVSGNRSAIGSRPALHPDRAGNGQEGASQKALAYNILQPMFNTITPREEFR